MALTKSQTQLLVIMGIALLSLGGSYLLFYLAQDGEGWGTTNHGRFVQPHTNVKDLGWHADPSDVTQQARWWLWVVADQCDAVCLQQLKDLRAAHILLNREASRVKRGFTQLGGLQDLSFLKESDSLAGSIAQISVHDTSTLQPGVYIVDPIGNLVFHYTMDQSPKEILTDLKRLLKVSQIG